jgi:hypothetical protein
MDYNKIANLIVQLNNTFMNYTDVIDTLNFHSSLINKKLNLPKEKLNISLFEEDYLNNLIKYYVIEAENLIEKYKDVYYDVDSDDYK